MNVVLLPSGFTGRSSSVGKSPPMTSNDAFLSQKNLVCLLEPANLSLNVK